MFKDHLFTELCCDFIIIFSAEIHHSINHNYILFNHLEFN